MEVYTCDSVSYVICRNLTFLMLDLETKDVVDWGYRMPEPGEPEVIHEDTWAPFAYSFTEDNYLDVITGKCTLYSYQEDEHGNHVSESTSYYNDEYRFVYE